MTHNASRPKKLLLGILFVFLAVGLNINSTVVSAGTTVGSNISTAGNLTAGGSLKFTSGANNNYILTTDASGNATWISVGTVLGNGTTDSLPQGTTNKYYDSADVNIRVDARIDLQKSAANGLAPLDANALVPMAQLPAGTGNGLATLDAGAKIPTSQIPSIAITDTYPVADIAARDALTVQTGDVAVVADAGSGESRSYIWGGSSWIELLIPTDLFTAKANNLSDLTSPSTARTNLGLGTSNSPTFAGLMLTADSPAYAEGKVFYDSAEKTLAYYSDISGTTLNVGEEERMRVYNQTGSPISDGKAVYINGFYNGTPTVALAKADSKDTARAIGIMTTATASGAYGYVTILGLIHDLDTSSYSTGDHLYLSATVAGGVTTTKPSAPSLAVPMGYVTKSDATTGIILVTSAGYFQGLINGGAVPFGAASGELDTDSTNLFWDDFAKRLGIGDNTPAASLTVGSGDLFEVFGDTGNITAQGDLTLTTGGGTITSTGGGLTLASGGASNYSTTSGDIAFQPAGAGTTASVQIGAGTGSDTPDLLVADIKNTSGDPSGTNGAIYYNSNSNKFRCYVNGSWSDCDTTGGTATLQTAYNGGATITTAGSTPIAFTLTSGDFNVSGTHAVNLTPTETSQFTSGGALTLTAGSASTWSTSSGALNITSAAGLALQGGAASSLATTAGNIILQPAGTGTTANVQIGSGTGSATPDLLVADAKSDSGDPSGTNGAIYYNSNSNKFRCYENGSWKNCDTTGGTTTLQTAYNGGAAITTAGSTDIVYNLTSGNFNATGAGSVSLTPTGASSFASGGALTLTGGAASTWGTTAGDLTLQAAGSGATANIKVGTGGVGSGTPDLFGLDVKSTAGDPAGYNGAMYYNANLNVFRCYEAGSWKDCDTGVAPGSLTLQQVYNEGATITTAGSTDLALTLASGNFTASGAGSVSLTPTGASSFASGGALTLTGGAASTWGTTAGNLSLQAAGSGATADIQIGAGGSGSATPDLLKLDVKSTTGDPAGANGSIYYNAFTNRFRCYEDSAWVDCGTNATSTSSLQDAYNHGGAITTASSSDIAFALASGNFTASGAGSVSLAPAGASSFTSGGALTLTGGAASVWKTTSGNLTLDSAATLNLGTTNTTAVGIGKSGATTTINGPLSLDDYATFNTSLADPAYAEGRLFYDSTNKSLSYYNDLSTEEVHIGQEYTLRVYNQTGSTINKGQVVYVSGVFSDIPSVSLARADIENTARAMGVVKQDIANGNFGYVTTRGLVINIDTSAFSTGDAVYLSPIISGALTSARPAEPNFSIPIGYVVKSNPTTGIILTEIVSRPWPGSYAAGGLAFGGSNGFNTEDVTNLFWDNSNKRLGIGDNTPQASLTVGNGDLFEVFGDSGNVTTQGNITLTTGGGNITATGGGLSLSGAGASSFATTSGDITLQAAGTGTTANIQIGSGGTGSATPDLFGFDVKSSAGDPSGFNGATYYNNSLGKFRCYESGSWRDCITAGTQSLQNAYNGGAAITTAGSTDIVYNLTSGNFNATGAGSVNLTPTGVASFTSGGALTLTGGAASTWGTSSGALTITSAAAATWGTSAGNLILQAGSGTVSLGTSTNLTAAGTLTVTAGTGTALTLTSPTATTWSTTAGNLILQAGSGTVSLGNSTALTAGGALTLSSGSAAVLTINSGTTGTLNIGTDASAETINIGTGASAKALTLGSANTTSSTTVQSGSGGLTLTGGGASTLSTSSGTLTLDSAAALNLGTTNVASVFIGKSGITTTNNGALTSVQTLTASNGLALTTGALNLTATSGALAISGLSASSIDAGSNALTFTSSNFNTTATGINGTNIGATTPGTGKFTTLTSTGATDLANAGASNVTIATTGTGNVSIGNSTGTFALTSNGGLNVTTGGVMTGGTWNGNIINIAHGGTNSTDTPTNGGVAYGTGSAYAFTSAGTSGQILKSNGAAAPTWTNGGTMMLTGNSSNTAINNTALYFPITGGVTGNATDSQAGTRSLVSRSGTVKNLYVKLSAALAAGKTGSVTVYKNGVATALNAVLSVGQTSFSDTTDSFTVAAGDEIGILVTTTGNVKFSWAADLTY